jgi:signal transduction histidine kinase
MDFVSDRESLHIQSDAAMLGSIAVYLLSSAVQNTDRGRIALILNTEASLIRITVTDTGCGIQKHMVAFRAQDGDGPSDGESGLVIARRLLELSGGTLDVASKAGEGAIIQVTLPVEPTSRSRRLHKKITRHPAAAPPHAGLRPRDHVHEEKD